jgi:uncharacterized alkaline shock family protein YloU
MKTKHFLVAVMALGASVMITACGSKKQALQTTTGQVAIEQDVCEKIQEEKPAVRAVGVGEHFKEMTARNIAEVQARGQFARMLGSKIKTSTAQDAGGYSLYSGDSTSGDSVDDQMAKANDFVQSITSEVAANMVLIKTSKYILPNKQYKVYVCLEYDGSVSKMATDIAKRVEQRIPDEEKLKMNFEFERYRKQIEEELEKSR